MTISAVSHIVKHRIPLPLNAKSKYYVVSTPTAGGSINHPSPSTLEAPPNEPNECHSLRFDERTKRRYQEMFFFFKYSSHTESFGVWSRYRQTVMDIWKRRLHAYADGATQCRPLFEWQQNPNFLHFISISFFFFFLQHFLRGVSATCTMQKCVSDHLVHLTNESEVIFSW